MYLIHKICVYRHSFNKERIMLKIIKCCLKLGLALDIKNNVDNELCVHVILHIVCAVKEQYYILSISSSGCPRKSVYERMCQYLKTYFMYTVK